MKESKEHMEIFHLPQCPHCGRNGRYVEYLFFLPGQKMRCPICKKEATLSFTARSGITAAIFLMICIIFNTFVLEHTSTIFTVLISTLLLVFLFFLFLPFTMALKAKKKERKK